MTSWTSETTGNVTDARLASSIAVEAGNLLLRLRQERAGAISSRALGRMGDELSNVLLLDRLAVARPDDAVLSEESIDDKSRLNSDRVWIIDPLDGTRQYGMLGREDWAVHVALWDARRGIIAAAVAQPALGAVYASDDTAKYSQMVTSDPLRIMVSDSRIPAFVDTIEKVLGAQIIQMGSAGAKAMAVLRGEADAYAHAGGLWEWDYAAPVGVAQAAGLHCSRLDGSALRYNESDPYLPDLLICRTEVVDRILSAIAG
ncbi:3'(2'),5'-bisphosphate nucleotidase CysQ (plasmid) [Rhodococcus sp. ZPP]|uniref:3'(2'),5'-bisphosphate nucleotidase CysQ n=1 Tax=Rhodococcus TaxID=1827 RepID=UPI001AD88AF7|nr:MULTISPECIES: 3'(2'),5'-bisphosphate nucleotidase CysQ [Rhodococcus]MBO8150772.1 3'(2'),5'-bisphosphate nucleotidase CysQ [Rhodococcus erythropolis]QTJ70949.1 3'(2'),5'-bisphosphate nucleotidase CysQ [Rhodococcus sp. ZPP]